MSIQEVFDRAHKIDAAITAHQMQEIEAFHALKPFITDVYRFLDWTPEHIADQTQRWMMLRDELKARAEALLAGGVT